MSEAPEEAKRIASSDLDRIARTTARIAAVSFGVALLGAVAALGGPPPQLGLVLVIGGITFGALYGVAWRRATMAKRVLSSSPRAARCIGWCRPPDGCNYALFFTTDDAEPDLVVRLPLRRRTVDSTQGWLYGSTTPALLGGVALVGPSGLLATGRVVPERTGRKRWDRRSTEPGRWVQRPPEDRFPRGGE